MPVGAHVRIAGSLVAGEAAHQAFQKFAGPALGEQVADIAEVIAALGLVGAAELGYTGSYYVESLIAGYEMLKNVAKKYVPGVSGFTSAGYSGASPVVVSYVEEAPNVYSGGAKIPSSGVVSMVG